MLNKKMLVIVTLTMLLLIGSFIPSIIATESDRLVNSEDILREINDKNFSLQVIGDYDMNLKNSNFNIAKNTHSKKDPFPGSTDGVVVSEDKISEIFQSENKENIKNALNSGKTFFLLGKKMSTQNLADFLDYDINLEEDIKNPGDYTDSEQAIYVSSNGDGEFTFGEILNSEKASSETFKESIILEAWIKRDNINRRGDVGGKKSLFEEHARTYIFSPEEVSAEIYPSIGSGWHVSFGPQEYTWNTEHGHLFERKRGYYLEPSKDEDSYNDWTALTMYMEAVPDSSDSASKINISSDTSYSDTNSGIGRYGPQSDPGTNSLDYSIGLNSDGTVGFSASWSVTSSDLAVYNNSCTSCGVVDITLDYDVSSSYAEQTSTHEPAFSYTNPEGATYSDMINQRSVTFYGWGYQGREYTKYEDTTTSPLYGTNVNIN